MTAAAITHQTPCDAFRAFRTYAMLIGSLAGMAVGYFWLRLEKIEDRATARNESMVEVQTDMRYVRADLAEIKAVLRMREFPDKGQQ